MVFLLEKIENSGDQPADAEPGRNVGNSVDSFKPDEIKHPGGERAVDLLGQRFRSDEVRRDTRRKPRQNDRQREKERGGDEFSHRHFLAHGGAEFEPVCAGGVAGFAATAPESDTRGAKPLISFTISSS